MSLGKITPKQGKPSLGINPTGGVIQNTGVGLQEWLQIRGAADGEVLNGVTVNNFHSLDSTGKFDVSDIPLISLFVHVFIGSLTSLEFYPEFADALVSLGSWAQLSDQSLATNSVTLSPYTYKVIVTGNYIVTFPNPGAQFMRVVTLSSGVTTNSSMTIYLGAAMHSAIANIGL